LNNTKSNVFANHADEHMEFTVLSLINFRGTTYFPSQQ